MPTAKKALTDDERRILDGVTPLKPKRNSPGVLGPSTYWEDTGQHHGKWLLTDYTVPRFPPRKKK